MSDYDAIKHQTLLFFLDHLSEKKQPKSLHDLSCQFGAKGFTKEMRQVAGGSLAGLRKFLAQFPYLFAIEGDEVMLSPIEPAKDDDSCNYVQETIDFFIDKLHFYGNAEVPLKSLFGHRSQASSKIRHVSGQNVREFRQFLENHPDTFVVRDDYVVLRSVLDEFENDDDGGDAARADDDANERRTLKRLPEEVSFDPYLMAQLVSELEELMFQLAETGTDKIEVDALFAKIITEGKLATWTASCIKAPSDLVTFLHMNSRVFLVQGNTASLNADHRELLRKRKPKERTSLLPALKTSSNNNVSEKVALGKVEAQMAESSQPKVTMMTTTTKTPSKLNSMFNQSIRSQIIRIVSNNIQQDLAKNIHGANGLKASGGGGEAATLTNGDSAYDVLDLCTLRPKMIVSNTECHELIKHIFEHRYAVAFDLEGFNLGGSGEVTLVKLGIISEEQQQQQQPPETPKIYIIDVFLNRNLIEAGLRELFESEMILKVGHDVRTNSAALYKNYNITLKNVFDTQIAHLILQQQSTGRPAYKPNKYISLAAISLRYGGPNLNPKMRERLHRIYKKDNKYWQRRPLTEEMLQFAVPEVYALLSAVYVNMASSIKAEYEPLFKQLVFESIFANIHTDEIKQIKKQRKFELEVTDLKLKLLNSDKRKVVLSNREIKLLRYIDLTDEIRNKLDGQQNVTKKLSRYKTRKDAGDGGGEDDDNKEEENGGNSFGSIGSSGGDKCDDDDDDDEEDGSDDDLDCEDRNDNEDESLGGGGEADHLIIERYNSCCCQCHRPCRNGNVDDTDHRSSESMYADRVGRRLQQQKNNSSSNNNKGRDTTTTTLCDMATQTLSTGDIVITKIYFNDPDQNL